MDARIILVAVTLLAGCATPEPVTIRVPVEVRVPVPVRAEPPAELADDYHPQELPVFIQPSAEHAAAALSAQGLADLRRLLRDLLTRDRAWRAWATDPENSQGL